jgi:rubrerythrin
MKRHASPAKVLEESETLAFAYDAENIAAEIYLQLSRLLKRDPELRALYALLSEEERSHARRIEHFAEQLTEKCPTCQMSEQARESAMKTLAEAIEMREQLKQATELDAERAYEIAINLEEAFGAVHAEVLAAQKDPMLSLFFAELTELDQGHAHLLEKHYLKMRKQ